MPLVDVNISENGRPLWRKKPETPTEAPTFTRKLRLGVNFRLGFVRLGEWEEPTHG